MYQQVYFMDKRSGTFADVLATYGLAAILDEVLAQAKGRDARRRVRLQDIGPYYTLKLDEPLRQEWVRNCRYFVGTAPYITTQRTLPAPEGCTVRDVEQTWEQFRTYQAMLKELQKVKEISEDLRSQIEDARPPHDWAVVTLLGTRQMQALKTYNRAVSQWALTREHFTFNLETILRMCAAPYADLDAVAAEWRRTVKIPGIKPRLTALQLFNPHQGKGQNRPKANVLSMGNVASFWLLEYLKASGLWLCAAPRTVRGNNDRKTYVLAPMNMTLGAHRKVFEEFEKRLWNESAVKMDCLAALLYTQVLLEYSEAGQIDELDFEGYGPEDVVAGFHVVHYKLLSRNAYTAMNLAFIGLPAWTGDIQSHSQVQEMKGVIDEHLDIVRNIDEGRSDGYNLLVHYRDFLSGQQLEAFFDFTVGYSQYMTSEWETGHRWVRPFRTDLLGRLIVSTKKELRTVIENPGFQNVAYAIRHSTIIPQGRKARKQDYLYSIRYGLGRGLKQKSHHRDDFIAALGDFMQSYNAENSQVLESKKQQMRKDLRTSDIEELVGLVDDFGSEVVCNLLVAYGYAREPWGEEENNI